jgi:uncharacterized membrane protein
MDDDTDFLRIRSVDRLAPATRGPDSFETGAATTVVGMVTAGTVSTSPDDCIDVIVVVVVAVMGGITDTTLVGSAVTITALGYE